MKPLELQFAIPTVPPGRTARKSSRVASEGRGAYIAPKADSTASK